jgi:hypothetical protein
MKNWWYYYKWYVICGAIVVGVACYLVGNAFGLWKKSPDIQIAYVGSTSLSDEAEEKLQEIFTAAADDYNGDGEVIVKINSYVNEMPETESESAYYQYASEVTLISDIEDCESYFFLMDDPDDFQQEYHLLANADASCPDDTDYSLEGKITTWTDGPLDGLSLGRRSFYGDKTTDNADGCSRLWDTLISES